MREATQSAHTLGIYSDRARQASVVICVVERVDGAVARTTWGFVETM